MSDLQEDAVGNLDELGEELMILPAELGPGDLGVAKWAQWDLQRLLNHLGFMSGRPALFAEWRPRSGLAFELDLELEELLKSVKEEDREYFKLLWHQAVGIAALSEGYWVPKAVRGGMPGMLLADTVGLGKTVEVLGLIAMIVQTRQAEIQEAGVRASVISEYIPLHILPAPALRGRPHLSQ